MIQGGRRDRALSHDAYSPLLGVEEEAGPAPGYAMRGMDKRMIFSGHIPTLRALNIASTAFRAFSFMFSNSEIKGIGNSKTIKKTQQQLFKHAAPRFG